MIEALEGRVLLSGSPVGAPTRAGIKHNAFGAGAQHARPSIILAPPAMVDEYINLGIAPYVIGGDIGSVDIKITSVKRNKVFGTIEFDSHDGTIIGAKINSTLTRGNRFIVPMHSRGTSGTLNLTYNESGVPTIGGSFKGTSFGGLKNRHIIGVFAAESIEVVNTLGLPGIFQ